jgi:adenine-specific DNA-methyltransferase
MIIENKLDVTNCNSMHVYTIIYLWSQPVVIEEQELKRASKYVKTNNNDNVSYVLLSKLQRTFSINNRRYLGNKYKLNQFIKAIISKECGDFETFADLFAGTGAVASIYQDKHLIVNDILYSNYVCHQTWFGTEKYSKTKIVNFINRYNFISISSDNYMSKNYSDTYFSKKNCQRIGFIREDIEENYKNGTLNDREKCILITSLLYAMDKIANTCGHYDAYRKNGELNKNLELLIPKIEKTNIKNEIYNEDINNLVKVVSADIVYLDPPYNSRQYCDAYHLLENVARWEKPKVTGIAKKMDRTSLKSDYCTISATQAFEDLIKNIRAKYIVLSYNNMANKGNERSNAKLSDEDILTILSAKGKVQQFSQNYKAFSTGKSNVEENAERLFVCQCF